jgi:hypothetical protein
MLETEKNTMRMVNSTYKTYPQKGRGISLLLATYKICSKIIAQWISKIAEVILLNNQTLKKEGCA